MLYRRIVRPILFRLPPEMAHGLALKSLSLALGPDLLREYAVKRCGRSPFGAINRFGLSFGNPVGLAAGFDKEGVAVRGLSALGFGFIEVGTVTYHPQRGNPRPRLFRLPVDRALINRLGFNNGGAITVAAHLASNRPDCVLGINIGKSRIVPIEAATADYVASLEVLHSLADYIAINVSSPNTPHLRELQHGDALSDLLGSLKKRSLELAERSGRERAVPLLLKISPDLQRKDLETVLDVVRYIGLDGIIATNTTTNRDNLDSPASTVKACGEGGLSGAPLRSRSTEMVGSIYRLVAGKLPIIAVGGIFTAQDAWEKICAGASLVQSYTGFIYEGFCLARDINEGLSQIFEKEGFNSFDQAVGCRAEELAQPASESDYEIPASR